MNNVLQFGPTKYIKKILDMFPRLVGQEVPTGKVTCPVEPGKHPELDLTPFLPPEKVRVYWSLIGQLSWAVTLGRIDIYTAVMTYSRFRPAPRVGHMEDVIRVFQFLRQYKKTVVKFVTENPDYSKLKKLRYDWLRLYDPVEEELDPAFPEPKGK